MIEYTLKPLPEFCGSLETCAWQAKHAMTCALLDAQAAAYLARTGVSSMALDYFRSQAVDCLRLFQSRSIQYQELLQEEGLTC